jgi:hypothetical protein
MPASKNDERIENDLPTWDVEKYLKADGFYLIQGRRGSGKTSYSEVILQLDPKINECIIICMAGSEKVKANWEKSIPKLQIIDPDLEYLKNVIKIQNIHTKKYAARGKPLPTYLHVNLILDDVALYSAFTKSTIFEELAASSRNLGMRIFVLAQYWSQVFFFCFFDFFFFWFAWFFDFP